METVLIAYNDASQTELHSFFESCADGVKQLCFENNYDYTSVYPPNLTEHNVISSMDKHAICFVASHGDSEGIYNEKDNYVVSTKTTNYSLSGKIFYAISCLCANKLMPELKRIGLETFVGYDDNLRVVESEPMFCESAIEGLKAILEKNDKSTAKKRMLDKYTELINNAPSEDIKMLLLHNREHLCFE